MLVISLGCSKQDDPPEKNSSLSPPEWLHGTWEYKSEDIMMLGVEVSASNVKLLSDSGIFYDIAEQIRSVNSAPGGSVEIEESIKTADSYEFTFLIFADNSEQLRNTYRFDRVNIETILFSQNSVSTKMTKR